MMYGSFTKGEGDQYSDIEFYVFLKDDTVSTFDSAKWLYEVAPYSLLYQNEYGTEVVIFENLIRGEFHFLSEREMNIIPSFKESGYIPDRSEEHTSELQSRENLVCRLLLEKKNKIHN